MCDDLEAIERELDSCQWSIDLLYGVMARLVAQRDGLRQLEAKERARLDRAAKRYLGEAVPR